MNQSKLQVGLVACSQAGKDALCASLAKTGVADVVAAVPASAAGQSGKGLTRLAESMPQILVVDVENGCDAAPLLHRLRTELPKTWLLVASQVAEPQWIIEVMRAGAREFLSKPVTPQSLLQAFQRYRQESRLEVASPPKSGQIYAVVPAKEGVGATTLAINLAMALGSTAQDLKIGLVDMNRPIGDVAAFLNLKSQFTVADALAANARLDATLLESYVTAFGRISVLPGIQDFDTNRAYQVGNAARLFEVISQTFSHAFVDLPPEPDREFCEVMLEACSDLLLVLTLELPVLWRADRLVRFLSSCGASDKIRLIVNRRNQTTRIPVDEVERVLRLPVFWSLTNDYKASTAAINAGEALVNQNHSELARGYQQLAEQLSGVPMEKKRRRLLEIFS